MEKTIEESKQGESLVLEPKPQNTKKLYIESYGCAMNFSDSEIVASILLNDGYNTTQTLEEADLVLVNTCSIRDKAEQTIRKRLEKYNAVKRINPKMKVGVLGCMAERLKDKFLEEEKIVDLVVGPDAYKDIPNLLKQYKDSMLLNNITNVKFNRDKLISHIQSFNTLTQSNFNLSSSKSISLSTIESGTSASKYSESFSITSFSS